MTAPNEQPKIVRQASPREVSTFFAGLHMTVLTLLGYSGVEYEDKAVMLVHVARLLDQVDPKTTILNIGATAVGLGAAYELAKQKGFTTSGIVSTRAKETRTELSPWVDIVFYVKDEMWGGLVKGTEQLSPTSTAMVDVSDSLVAIGGGDIARDEFIAAKGLGKIIQFIPADLNHAIARETA